MDLQAILDPALIQGLLHSLLISLVLLLPLLWLALRLPLMASRGRGLLLAIVCLPLLLPVSQLPLDPLFNQALSQLPLLLLPLYLGLRHHSPGLGEAAASLGMGGGARLRHIHLPRLLPPIFIALLLGTLAALPGQMLSLGLPVILLLAVLLLTPLYALIRLTEARR